MKFTAILVFTFLFQVLSAQAALQVRVQSIHDGDTLTVIGVNDGVRYKIRLMGVDTPEVDFNSKSQGDSALVARDLLRTLAPVGTTVDISEDSETDKHGRILGRIIVDGKDVNKEILRQGWGYVYFIYPFNKRLLSDYIQAAKEAYQQKRGLFSNEYQNVEEPYQFRMSVRNQVGKNPVGDFETKRLYKSEDLQMVPVWKRVFFPSSDLALQNGYSF